MSGTLQLYTRENHEGLTTFRMGSFSITDLTPGTDYVQNRLFQKEIPSMSRSVYCIKLTINSSGINNLDVDNNNQPFPVNNYVSYSASSSGPSLCDLTVPKLLTRPADWDVHWRDKYNTRNYSENSGMTLYSSGDNIGISTSGGGVGDLPFTADTYSETNPSRFLFWTLGDIYFALENGWHTVTVSNRVLPEQYATAFYTGPYNPDNVNWNRRRMYVNCARDRGISGAYIFDNYENYYLQSRLTYRLSNPSDVSVQRIFTNFVNFNYPVTLPSGAVETMEFIGVVIYQVGVDGIPLNAVITAFEKPFWAGTPQPPNDGPASGIQGGHGTFTAPSDNRGDRAGATAAAIASAWDAQAQASANGYNNYYIASNLTAPFDEMCERLWDPDIIQSWINQAQSPLQAIITCHQIPSNLAPSSVGTAEVIKAAGLGLSDTAAPTFSQYITSYHVGDVDISGYTDSFADFTNTSIYIHLPYIGTYQLDTAACMHGWLAVDYLCDVTSGHCTALITTSDKFGNSQIRYEFKGDCSRTIPLFQRENPLAKVAGSVLPAALTIGATAVGGVAARAIAGSMASGIADAFSYEYGETDIDVVSDMERIAHNAIAGKMDPGRASTISGAIGSIGASASTAALSGAGTVQSNASGGDVTSPIDTTCWLLITRPQWSAPELYAREKGYASDISGKIEDFSGLLMVQSCELNGIDATDSELHEIDSWLKSGVYLS